MIGSRQWMEHSHGKLSLAEKCKFTQNSVLSMSYQYAERYFKKTTTNSRTDLLHLNFKQIEIPNTPIVQHAIATLSNCGLNTVIQHAWRCFYWAIALAKYQQWQFDHEELLIACLMHKIGLTDTLLPESCHCFTYASALQAERLCHLQHYPEGKTQNIANAICLHLNTSLSHHQIQRSYEVRLLQQATACDMLGSNLIHITKNFQRQVLQHHPRQQFNQKINQLYQREARRNPDSRIALLRRFGLSIMIRHNGFAQ